MAYINVVEWKTDQVTDWLKGIDFSMYRYLTSFTNNQINGMQLLNIRPYELEELGVKSVGHQEIILEALRVLKDFHYNLDKENLQYLALHVATSAHSLFKQLSVNEDQNNIDNSTLKDVTRTIGHIKKLIFWLDRAPFQGQHNYYEIRTNMLKLGLEMATCAQRGRFVEDPVSQIILAAEKLAKLADYIIQDISDPMLLQPATLDLVTSKKRESELPFNILPSFYGIHQMTDIKYNSPVHNSSKIEEGDELVQINYQTVVGWQYEKVLFTLSESSPDLLLTIKKRPKHTKMYGQVYIKPYRLPSKKRSYPHGWGDNALPSPRAAEFFSTQEYFKHLEPLPEKHVSSDSDSSNSDIFTPVDVRASRKEELYMKKSRGVLQRRHSICGDGYSLIKALDLHAANQYKDQRLDDSPSLRDKSVSFGYGLEMSSLPRPTTHLGITQAAQKEIVKPEIPAKPEIKPKPLERKLPPPPIPVRPDVMPTLSLTKDNNKEKIDNRFELQGISKVVRFDSNTKLEACHIDTQYTCNIDNTILETFVPISYIDDDTMPSINNTSEILFTEIDTPPAVEPRQAKIKPIPPPRPSKNISQSLLNTSGMKNDSSKLVNTTNIDDNKSKVANVVPLKNNKENPQTHYLQEKSNIYASNVASRENLIPSDPLELHTSTTNKALTLKKKNSLLSKRRKVTLKLFTNSDIQGHLYRRTKNKHGASYWAKLYVVLLDTALYGFKTKQASKADCLIFLSGFTVTIAREVHSKSFAFKVYHPLKTFYFAAETEEAQKQWIDYIHQATLKASVNHRSEPLQKDIKELFSETDSSDDEFDLTHSTQMATPSPMSLNYSSASNNSKNSGSTPTSTKPEGKYHLGFGSLKKSLRNLNSSETPSDNRFLALFSSSRHSERKNSLDIPVPTAKFKSYRKISTNLNISPNITALDVIIQPEQTAHLIGTKKYHDSEKHSDIGDLPEDEPIFEKVDLGQSQAKKLMKCSSYNYMHASNPNLVDFQAHTIGPPKAIELVPPKNSNANRDWDASHSLNGFMTLKDLMLQEQAQNATDPYNKRVCLGIEKSDDKRSVTLNNQVNINASGATKNEENAADNVNRSKINKIQKRSLPVTPDYAQSFKPDDQDILYTRSREGQKLRDFGYELITGDDRVELKNNLHLANLQQQQQQHHENITHSLTNGLSRLRKSNKISSTTDESLPQSVKKRSLNWMQHCEKDPKNNSSRGGSFNKKHKNKSVVVEKFDHLMASSEKLFNFKHTNTANETENLKSKYTNVKSNVVATSVVPAQNSSPQSSSSVPQTSDRGASYLTKLSFSSKSNKEKKLLGSPRLHRAIFGYKINVETDPKAVDHEIFSPITYNKIANDKSTLHQGFVNEGADIPLPLTPSLVDIPPRKNSDACIDEAVHNSITTVDPNIEYPPVFEAEIYSLSDLSANILKRKHQNPSSK